MKLNAWEVGQIVEGLKLRAETLRSEAHKCDIAAKNGHAGDDLRLTASHIDELIEKVEK